MKTQWQIPNTSSKSSQVPPLSFKNTGEIGQNITIPKEVLNSDQRVSRLNPTILNSRGNRKNGNLALKTENAINT